jgi:hypothetical protein
MFARLESEVKPIERADQTPAFAWLRRLSFVAQSDSVLVGLAVAILIDAERRTIAWEGAASLDYGRPFGGVMGQAKSGRAVLQAGSCA